MATATVEERLAQLERQLEAVQRQVEERLPERPDSERTDKCGWQAIVGTFANDPLYDEAMRLGREWRDKQKDLSEDEG